MEEVHFREKEEEQETPQVYWCGFRVILLIGLIGSVVIYLVGAIIAGFAFHQWNYDVKCFNDAGQRTDELYPIVAPVDVVGVCMMSFGGGVFLMIFVEWFILKPIATYLIV